MVQRHTEYQYAEPTLILGVPALYQEVTNTKSDTKMVNPDLMQGALCSRVSSIFP